MVRCAEEYHNLGGPSFTSTYLDPRIPILLPFKLVAGFKDNIHHLWIINDGDAAVANNLERGPCEDRGCSSRCSDKIAFSTPFYT